MRPTDDSPQTREPSFEGEPKLPAIDYSLLGSSSHRLFRRQRYDRWRHLFPTYTVKQFYTLPAHPIVARLTKDSST